MGLGRAWRARGTYAVIVGDEGGEGNPGYGGGGDPGMSICSRETTGDDGADEDESESDDEDSEEEGGVGR